MGVPAQVLEALESDDWARLEAPVYVRGYLRKYARLLGLPEDDVVSEYESSAVPTDPEVRAHASRTLPRGSGKRLLGPLGGVALIVILVLAGIWAWHRLHRPGKSANVPAAAVSAMMAATRNAPAVSSALPGAATGRTPVAVSAAAPAGSGASAASGSSGPAGTAKNAMHLVLSLSAPSWVEAYGPRHKRLYYNLAASGDSLHFDVAHGPVTLFLGNAPAASLTVNGKPYPVPSVSGSDKTARFTIKGNQSAPAQGTSP